MDKLENKLLFAKNNESVKIPTKREEDGAFDIYANFEEDYIVIQPHETKMIPTGLHSAFSSDYVAILKERGSTGTRGIGQRAGVVDSGYRGEWFVPLTNHNDETLLIFKDKQYEVKTIRQNDKALFTNILLNEKEITFKGDVVFYPYEKAISQVVMVEVPKLHIEEVSMDEILSYESERGTGALGSSNK